MGTRSIIGVLGVLRKLKRTEGLNLAHSTLQYLQNWSEDSSPSVVLRMSIAIIEQIEDARNILAASDLTDEAKEGLLATLDGLSAAFSLGGMNTQLQNYLPALDSAITNFAIVSSLAGSEFPEEANREIDALVVEIKALRDSAEVANLGRPLADTVTRLLNALLALLHNAAAVGVDAALAAYLDLVVQLRRTQPPKKAGDDAKSGIWATITSWSDRLVKISNLVDAGSKLAPILERAPEILKLLG
ncbi:MAG: hypothetical protein V4444_06105 [Pseudomonadota bacterium]